MYLNKEHFTESFVINGAILIVGDEYKVLILHH